MPMKNERKTKTNQAKIPDLMFQDVKIPESLAPTPINPALDEAYQIKVPRNPGPSIHALDWDVPTEPLVNNPSVPPTPNPHTNLHEDKKTR